MSLLVLVFASFELPLLVIRRLFPKTKRVLPLGGDEFSQLAILVILGLFLEISRGWILEALVYFH